MSIEQKSQSQKFANALEFLGLRRSVVGLLTMVILVGMGENMAKQFLSPYLRALGASFIIVGFLNGMDVLLGALYSYPGGYLSDRLGSKRALLVFNAVSIMGYLIVVLFPTWQALFAGALFFMSWTAVSLPATMDIVSKVLPSKKRTMGVTVHSLVRRIPMALGPIAGGWCIHLWGEIQGVRIAFGFAIFFAVVAAVAQQILIKEQGEKEKAKQPAAQANPWLVFLQMPKALRRLLVSDILIRFCEQIPYAFVVIWCLDALANPWSEVQFGYLRSVEMATAILIYIPVAYFADKGEKKPFVVITFCFFTAFPLLLLFCHSFWWLVAAFVVRGLKEFGEPTRKALILDLAPEGRKAAMFGLYYLIRDVVVSLAAFGSGFLWQYGPKANLLTAFGFGLAGTIWFAIWAPNSVSAERKLRIGNTI